VRSYLPIAFVILLAGSSCQGPISDWPTAGESDEGPRAEPGALGGGMTAGGIGGTAGGASGLEQDAGLSDLQDAGAATGQPDLDAGAALDAGCGPDAADAAPADASLPDVVVPVTLPDAAIEPDAALCPGAPSCIEPLPEAAAQVFENDADAAELVGEDAGVTPFAAPRPPCP
jgi:hypothetical protein